MECYNDHPVPLDGEAIQALENKLNIPDHPVIPFIEGDGTGPDIWKAARTVFDAAVHRLMAAGAASPGTKSLPARRLTGCSTIGCPKVRSTQSGISTSRSRVR